MPGLTAQTPPPSPPPQDPKPPATQAPKPPAPVFRNPVYVRRFSLGISASFMLPNPIRSEDITQNPSTNPPISITSTNDPKQNIAAYGAIAQLAVSERIAVAVHPTIRKIAFNSNTRRFEGTDNPTTFADERRITVTTGDTRARYLDVPVLMRYYGRDRTEDGHRWFAEAGPSARLVRGVRTSRQITLPDGSTQTDNSPAAHKKNVLGVAGGLGGQFIDPLGIRLVFGARYTRWFNSAFNEISGRSRRHQAEIYIALTF